MTTIEKIMLNGTTQMVMRMAGMIRPTGVAKERIAKMISQMVRTSRCGCLDWVCAPVSSMVWLALIE